MLGLLAVRTRLWCARGPRRQLTAVAEKAHDTILFDNAATRRVGTDPLVALVTALDTLGAPRLAAALAFAAVIAVRVLLLAIDNGCVVETHFSFALVLARAHVNIQHAMSDTPKSAIKKPQRHTHATLYKGEHICSQCELTAYYIADGEPRCGRHSTDKKKRLTMKPNPIVERAREQETLELFHAALRNTSQIIELLPYHKFGAIPRKRGFFTVLPNIGSGGPIFPSPGEPDFVVKLRTLSPMMLGPVEHREPGLPVAQNLENWYQARKVFRSEVLKGSAQALRADAKARRVALYNDEVPHRHKLGDTKAKHLKAAGHVPGTSPCLFSLFGNWRTGVEKRYNYIEARMFYCSWYEHLVRLRPEWQTLLAMYAVEQRSLLIAGDDAPTIVDTPLTIERINAWYLDTDAPFGHEITLATMLFLHAQPAVQPWRAAWLGEFGMTFREFYQLDEQHATQSTAVASTSSTTTIAEPPPQTLLPPDVWDEDDLF